LRENRDPSDISQSVQRTERHGYGPAVQKGRGRAVAEGLSSAPAESFALRIRRRARQDCSPMLACCCVEEGVGLTVARLNATLFGVDA
jgi:hypothetical protein